MTILLNVWNDFSRWISVDWTPVTFWMIVSVLTIIGLLGMVSFVKKSYAKEGKIKWSLLIVAVIVFSVVAVILAAKYA